MTTRADLPAQPAIVREWITAHNAAVRSVNKTFNGAIKGAMAGIIGFDEAIAMRDGMIEDLADALAPMPADVREAYTQWVAAYNAIVRKINDERQARINAREVAKVRAQACTVCFATHAGEC